MTPVNLEAFQGMTPGPWEVQTITNRDVEAFGIRGGGWFIADVYKDCEVLEPSAPANARAIASVPDLIAEVKALREALKTLCEATPTLGQCEASIQSLRRDTRMQDPGWMRDIGDAERCHRFAELMEPVRAVLGSPKPQSI